MEAGPRAVKISMRNVSKIYEGHRQSVRALADVTLDVFEGEITGLVGVSGSGKTTILNMIAGFLSPTGGQILIDGDPLTNQQRGTVMIFQEDAVFPWQTVLQNALYGISVRKGIPNASDLAETEVLLKVAGLDSRRDSFPKELSGGMKKKVEIVRAFAAKPSVVLADEPFGGIDAITKEELQETVLRLWELLGCTVIIATHDIEDAVYMAHRIAVLSAPPGRIKSIVTVPFGRPRNLDLKPTREFQEVRARVKDMIETTRSTDDSAPVSGEADGATGP